MEDTTMLAITVLFIIVSAFILSYIPHHSHTMGESASSSVTLFVPVYANTYAITTSVINGNSVTMYLTKVLPHSVYVESLTVFSSVTIRKTTRVWKESDKWLYLTGVFAKTFTTFPLTGVKIITTLQLFLSENVLVMRTDGVVVTPIGSVPSNGTISVFTIMRGNKTIVLHVSGGRFEPLILHGRNR